jgi:hypothetical protein
MKTISQLKEERNPLTRISDQELSESLVGKGVAISNNRQHATNKTKLFSLISQIQNRCRQGVNEDDQTEKINLQFQIAFELASALKIFAEMSTNNNNISTTAVLDAENIQKVLEKALTKSNKK